MNACSVDKFADPLSTRMSHLKADFANPPDDTRPGCYWYWINDNISKSGITKDLEAMVQVGIGRAYIGHIYNYSNDQNSTPVGDVKFMSEDWWEAVQWAVKEADRLGVEIGFFNSPGWSQSGGPWVKPSQSMRYLTHSETLLVGGQEIDQIILVPQITTFPVAGGSRPTQTGPKFTEKDFQDVRVIAFRQTEAKRNDVDMNLVRVSSDQIEELENLIDGSKESEAFFTGRTDLVINLDLQDLSESVSGIQSIAIEPLDFGYQLTCLVEASDDGISYDELTNYSEQRGHQGAKNKATLYVPFKPTKANLLRLTFNVSKTVRFSELTISQTARLGSYIRKQLGETSPSTQPAWNAYQWKRQDNPGEGSILISGEVQDLTENMDETGRLKWDAPEGNWVVLRMGMIPMGTQNAPSSPESQGLEVDKMNKEHVVSMFDGMVGEFIRKTDPDDRKALKYVIADSYETGPQNWTDGFIERFELRFGYSPEPYLPVLTGRVVDNPEISDRFLWDLRRLIVEGIAYDYVGGLREVCNDNDLILWLENYGHWGFPSEFLLYGSQSNQIGGEFWVGGVKDNIECRAAVSSAHIYGTKSIYAEAFTSNRNLRESPASLKKWCDWVFGVGVNHLILHVNIHQPDERKPGIIQWFGTGFNRHNTWFEQSKEFIDYIRRCAVMLKAGLPVVDVAYYIGEDAPMMQGPQRPPLPDGYNFDFINGDVLMNRCQVIDGKIVVEDGPSFSVLVLPERPTMRPEVAQAIRELVNQGASILGPQPEQSPSLQHYPECDQNLKAIASDLWADVDGINKLKRPYGKGWVYNGVGLSELLYEQGIEEDIRISGGENIRCATAGSGHLGVNQNGGIIYNHRKGRNTEIYFLANTTENPVEFTASLRCQGMKPSLWNAVTGNRHEAKSYSQEQGRTLLPLHLDAYESVFVVFDEKSKGTPQESASYKHTEYSSLVNLNHGWEVQFDKQAEPSQIEFEQLIDWTDHPDSTIRHYSGTATYSKTFEFDSNSMDQPVYLELDEVKVIATVFLNHQEVGTMWTRPWKIDISDYLQDGKNELLIKVSNTWNNQVYTDSKLADSLRASYISQPYNFGQNAPLHSAGLIGSATIIQQK